MYVVKRNGKQQSCQFDKIQSRISKLCYGLDQKVSVVHCGGINLMFHVNCSCGSI